MAGFDGFIYKKSHITLRSWLLALSFDPTTLIEIAVYKNLFYKNVEAEIDTDFMNMLRTYPS